MGVSMTHGEFVGMVRQMRSAQTEYFRVRSQAHLIEAKRLERLVDTAIRNFGGGADGHLDSLDAGVGGGVDGGGVRGV